MSDLGYVLCAIGAWIHALVKYRSLRKAPPERKAPIRAIIVGSALGGAPMLLGATVIALPLNRVTGIANLTVLLGWCLALAFLCASQVMLLYWHHSDRAWPQARRLMIIYGLVICGMVALFAVSPELENRHRGFTALAAGVPVLVAMLVLYFTTYLLGAANLVRLCWIWASEITDRIWLRRGFRIAATGMVFAAAYGAVCLFAVIGGLVNPALRQWSVNAPAIAGLGVPLVLLGYSIPRWGPPLSAAWTALRQFRRGLRDYRRLRPLWQALAPVNPAMIHTPDSLAERLSMDFRLFWRVIEINDWLHQLRTYQDPAVVVAIEHRARETGHSGNDLAALSEAAQIKAALARRQRGQRSDVAITDVAVAADAHHAFASERRRLVMIADALTDPLVDATLRDVEVSGTATST
ncbi:MAB_1171c family putative transporter [Amycolatopsis sp. NPDC059021]|uniref:MAB_1171c family putative transporter n=1 Tax=Amycolatopsis sp. NPDC059021 TaxID=3346704 RepID=UPI00366EC504